MALRTETARYTRAFLTFIGGSLLTLLLVMAFTADTSEFLRHHEFVAVLINLALFVVIFWASGTVLYHVEEEARKDERANPDRA
jgi:hypothetical protein